MARMKKVELEEQGVFENKKVKVLFKGNYREYIFNEVYDVPEDEAAMYVALGYAELMK